MICLICRQAKVVGGFTPVQFERGETYLMINNVPARICPYCGETYVSEEVAGELLRIAKELSQRGKLAVECEYSWGNKGTRP